MQVNKTIDDSQLSNPVANVSYYPVFEGDGSWSSETLCAKNNCLVRPETKDSWNRTWHYDRSPLTGDVTPDSFTLTFPGIAIYVYGIITKKTFYDNKEVGITHLSFSLDGQLPLSKEDYHSNGTSNPNEDFEYNTLVYSKAGLTNDTHTLQVILPRGQNSTLWNVFYFDYANYTIEVPLDIPPQSSTLSAPSSSPTQSTADSDSSRHSLSAGAVAGIALGAVVLVACLIVIVFLVLRKQSRRRSSTPGTIPYLAPGDSGLSESSFGGAESPVFAQRKKPTGLTRGRPLAQSGAGMGASRQYDEVAILRAEVDRLQAQNYSYADALTLPAYDGPRM